jgi:peptide chain release factor 2
MDGGEMEGEISSSLAPLREELDRLQEAALFDGEYDAGDAVVTLQSGTGGTDAQDWAEMMLRMYERWAANRGFKVELLEASPGRRQVSNPRPSPSPARTPTES